MCNHQVKQYNKNVFRDTNEFDRINDDEKMLFNVYSFGLLKI